MPAITSDMARRDVRVTWSTDSDPTLRIDTVVLFEGHSTEADIPNILAIACLDGRHQAPAITVHSVVDSHPVGNKERS